MPADLVKRIIFTLSVLLVCRIGSYIPIAGIDSTVLSEFAAKNQSGILGMFNMLSGGSLGRMSIFALAIVPYITASIIIQLLSIAYKSLDNLKKEGEAGRKKLNQLSRYLTLALASFQAYGIAVSLQNMPTTSGHIVVISSLFFKVSTVVTLVVGTMFLMWLGEQINAKGIGNGSSLIIFIGIISGIPSAIISTFELARKGSMSPVIAIGVCIGVVVMICVIVFFEKAQRKVVVQYPKKQVGMKLVGGDTTHIPLKLNTSGVLPPMFASSVLLFPLTIANFAKSSSPLTEWIVYNLNHGRFLFILLYIMLISFFSFFYTAVVFNSEETANNLRKHGAFIPGKRPGKHTSEYFDFLLTRLTVIGATYLSIVCVVPELLINKLAITFTLGGTSMLIIVNVIIETFSQIQSYMLSSRYEHLMKKMKIKSLR